MTEELLLKPAPRLPRPGTTAKVAAGLARHPRAAAGRATHLTGDLAKIAAGRSDLRPAKRDRRFADAGWDGNWLLRRVLQTYLAAGGAVDGLIDDAQLDWRAERQARFAASNVLDALAPSNFPLTNPAVLKATSTRAARTWCAARSASRATSRAAEHGRHEPVRGRREPGASRRAAWSSAPRSTS